MCCMSRMAFKANDRHRLGAPPYVSHPMNTLLSACSPDWNRTTERAGLLYLANCADLEVGAGKDPLIMTFRFLAITPLAFVFPLLPVQGQSLLEDFSSARPAATAAQTVTASLTNGSASFSISSGHLLTGCYGGSCNGDLLWVGNSTTYYAITVLTDTTGSLSSPYAAATGSASASISAPLWSADTTAGVYCNTQTWSLNTTVPQGVDAVGAASCPYVNFDAYPYVFPQGWAQNYIKTGTWNSQYNRLYFHVLCTTGVNQTPWQNYGGTVGTYIKPAASTQGGSYQGQHYYQDWAYNNYNGSEWMNVTLNRKANHRVGGADIQWPVDPEWVWPTDPAGPVHYYDGLTRFYTASPYVPGTPTNFSAGTCYFENYNFAQVSGEPDESVYSITEQYDGTSYHVDFSTSIYVTETFAIHYSTSDMKVTGFSSGTATPNITSDSSTTVAYWTSPALAKGDYYVGIRPIMTVVAASNSSPIRISTANSLGLSTGDQVIVSGVGGNTAANGTWTVINQPRQYWFGSAGVTNQAVTSVVVTGNSGSGGGTITVNLSVNHNLQVGQAVSITSTLANQGDWAYVGAGYVVQSTPTLQSFTLTNISVPNGTYTSPDFAVWSNPALDLQGSTGNGRWTSGGQVSATSDTSNFTEVVISDGTRGTTSSCDLNNDGVIDDTDVQIMVSQTLGQAPCTAAITPGTCNVIDVQRVINAALGGSCVTGP